MPNWNEVLIEIQTCNRLDALDFIRRKYLQELHVLTGRNVIAYYSGWLQKPGLTNTGINDEDKNALMTTIHGLDRSKGLDLILHTPGGDTAATESLVDYLRKMFDTDIRAIVPQLAMSAGTMIACSCKCIIMGKQSSLGPIDPQFGGTPCYGVIEEFEKAIQEIKLDPSKIPMWQVIVSKYPPTFLGECQKSIDMSSQMVKKWLENGMFMNNPDAPMLSEQIVRGLNNHKDTMSHARHIPMDECAIMGLKVLPIEEPIDGMDLQDLVLTIHHAYMHSFASSPAIKIVENHEGKAMILQHQQVQQVLNPTSQNGQAF